MNTTLLLALFSTTVLFGNATAEVNIDNNLVEEMNQAGPNGIVSALVYLDDQVDIKALSDSITEANLRFHERHQLVVETLRTTAMNTQTSIINALDKLNSKGAVALIQPFWISNVIRVDATPNVISQLAKRSDVQHVYLNYGIELVDPVYEGPVQQGGESRGGPEQGIIAIRADEVWNMGYTGEGVLVSTLDTGVQGSHEALADRWAGLRPEYAGHPEWAFLDPYTNNNAFPFDGGSHGTHTMGTVCGGAPGNSVGVAPDAHWITSAGIDRGSIADTVADSIQSFEWFIDPDGNSSTSWDVPRVCSNSWGLTTGHGYPNCDQTFWTYLDALEAAGCVVLFSAGNEGTSGLRRPGDRATDDYRTCAVAAIDPYSASYEIASFSSRGPTNCTPSGESAIKPDISAPGVSTYSSVPGGYSSYNGTSMASPHINGAIALMVQANPDLEVEAIKNILYTTAVDLGPAGEDNDYGHGLIDCVEAVNMALETVSVSWSYPEGRPVWIEPSGGAEIPITISSNQTSADPTTAKMFATVGFDTTQHPLVHDGGNNYRAVFPSLNCGADVSYYFTVETKDGNMSYSPFGSPDSQWSGTAWSGYESSYEENFQTDTGWTVEANADTGNWTRGIPAQGGVRCDPGSDSDGSGICYVTGNTTDEDIDGGSTVLTSPNLDGSSATAVLSYDFWYSNGANCGGADSQNDLFYVDISDDGGASWTTLDIVGPDGSEVSGGWITRNFPLAEVENYTPSASTRIRFTVGDLNAGSVIEAAVDAIAIGSHYCNGSTCPADITGDSLVNVSDLLMVIDQWGLSGDADISGDGIVNVTDLLLVVGSWGAC